MALLRKLICKFYFLSIAVTLVTLNVLLQRYQKQVSESSTSNSFDEEGFGKLEEGSNYINFSAISSYYTPQIISKSTLETKLLNKNYSNFLRKTTENNVSSIFKLPSKKQIIILSTWRSGSTFVEELLQSHPEVYDIYEPLIPYGMKRFSNESGEEDLETQKVVHDLLRCRYSKEYVKKLKKSPKEMIYRNRVISKFCSKKKKPICYQKKFLENNCSSFIWILMKLVRFGLGLLRPILDDSSLNPQVIFLVRDPRAVMQSRRRSVTWCKERNCYDPAILCQQMEDDLKAFHKLSKLFPGKLHLLRYEDLCLAPFNVTDKLMYSIGLDFDLRMKTFLATHTNKTINRPWSTVRKSSERVLFWTKTIDYKSLYNIQANCSNIMKKLGYIPVSRQTNLLTTDILGKFKP